MLKAMLVVTALGGGGDYTAEMPSMKECLDARITIAEQDPNVKTLCVPISNDSAKVQELIDSFMKMIEKIKDKETSREKFICDSSVLPGLVIQTMPPRINCNELPESPLWLPKPDWKPEHPLWKE